LKPYKICENLDIIFGKVKTREKCNVNSRKFFLNARNPSKEIKVSQRARGGTWPSAPRACQDAALRPPKLKTCLEGADKPFAVDEAAVSQ